VKVYILTDLEGVSGVTLKDQVFADRPYYEKARHLLTQDVNAAVQGAIDGGATDIVVLDAHGANSAYNFIYEELHEGARYIVGSPWPVYLPGLDSGYDAFIQLGAHSKAGTPQGVLEHTMSSEAWVEMRINGEPLGEMGLVSAAAGYYDIPTVLVTGDKAACDQAVELFKDIEVAPVKVGFSRSCAELLPPQKARELIRSKAEAAMKRVSDFKPFKIDGPVEMQVRHQKPVDVLNEKEGIKRIDRYTVSYSGKDIIEVLRRWMG
jgi:D-amino peptidase